MKPAPFEYYRPSTLDEALALMTAHAGEAKPLAGGQSLIPAMNFRLAQPSALIDLNQLHELSYVKNEDGGVRLGAMTRQRAIERSAIVAREAPLVREAMPFIAHTAIRNRGTVGGSLAHADPAAELPAVMLALEARFQAQSRARSRWIPAAEFFTGVFSTALEPDELLVEIAVPPLPDRSGWAFEEIARRHGDYALAGVAAIVALDDGARCVRARIALLSVGDRPVQAHEAARLLEGEDVSGESMRAAANAAAQQDIDPPADIHASSAYRRQLVGVLTRRALERAFMRARKAAGAP